MNWNPGAINMLLHGVTTVLFGLVCRKMVFGGAGRKTDLEVFIAMLLFASHPVTLKL